ncbi:MAG TPA: OmpA family protein [Syntrophales bacterium]|nr:OmpA family protein [Syntrophales bacterium]HPQ42741.1 OmpA family protein [Syntrophales bacterium]
MIAAHRIIVLTLVIVLCIPAYIFAQQDYSGPDDPKAVAAAQEALGRLGPEKGAIAFSGRTVDIIGLKSMAFAGSTIELEKILSDLGAKKVGTEILISLSGDVLFDFDKFDIKEEAVQELEKLVRAISELNKKNVVIEGHTDSKGSEAYNLNLSQKRAEAVQTWFETKGGLTDVVFQTIGYGESKPATSNTNPDGSDNPEGRAKNRRVEIRIR